MKKESFKILGNSVKFSGELELCWWWRALSMYHATGETSLNLRLLLILYPNETWTSFAQAYWCNPGRLRRWRGQIAMRALYTVRAAGLSIYRRREGLTRIMRIVWMKEGCQWLGQVYCNTRKMILENLNARLGRVVRLCQSKKLPVGYAGHNNYIVA